MGKQTTSTPEILILVMGATGVGKSTFINHLYDSSLAEPIMEVGKGLESCTRHIQPALLNPALYSRSKGQIFVVDTPGFDDSYGVEDATTLLNVIEWLKSRCAQTKVLFGGVIYLHDITSDRFSFTAKHNLDSFRRLCEEGGLLIGLTKLDRISRADANQRQQELTRNHWNHLIEKGAKILRFHKDDKTSASTFVQILVSNKKLGQLSLPSQIDPGHKALEQKRFKLPKFLRVFFGR